MLGAVMVNVFTMAVIMLCVVILNVVMLSVIRLNVVLLNVIMPSVALPQFTSVKSVMTLSPGPNVIKLFCLYFTDFNNKLECLSLASLSSPV
jgi:hypothetical protein